MVFLFLVAGTLIQNLFNCTPDNLQGLEPASSLGDSFFFLLVSGLLFLLCIHPSIVLSFCFLFAPFLFYYGPFSKNDQQIIVLDELYY